MFQQSKLNTLITSLKTKSAQALHQELCYLSNSISFSLPRLQENAQPASVLIPIILHKATPSMLFIERSSHLTLHANQIGFPGGKQDETDQDAKACMLRETQEELGIPETHIEIIAELGEWPSNSGYKITPFVGLLEPCVNIKPNQDEVKGVFEIPLDIALDLKNFYKKWHLQHQYYEMIYQNKRIWGFTGGLLFLLALYIEKNCRSIHS